jgi:hypothetical protein
MVQPMANTVMGQRLNILHRCDDHVFLYHAFMSYQYREQCLAEAIHDILDIPYAPPLDYSTMTEERKRLLSPLDTVAPGICREAALLIERHCCLKCWLKVEFCICGFITKGLEGKLRVGHRIVVLLHAHEFGRASNTGKLLLRLIEGAELLIFNVPQHNARLLQLLRQPDTVILFPASNSISAAAYAQSLHNPAKISAPTPSPTPDPATTSVSHGSAPADTIPASAACALAASGSGGEARDLRDARMSNEGGLGRRADERQSTAAFGAAASERAAAEGEVKAALKAPGETSSVECDIYTRERESDCVCV